VPSERAMPKCGRDWGRSGHRADTLNVKRLTQSVTLLPDFGATEHGHSVSLHWS
jgi:hypothetical protein